MRGLKLAILLGFMLMFVAGLAVGRTHKEQSTAAMPEPPSWIARELNLDTEQQRKMKQFWSDAMNSTQDLTAQFHEADRQRDDAIRALLTDEQWQKYDQINRDHDTRVRALRALREKPFREAEQKSREMLNPDQQKRFDEIMKDRGRRHGLPTGDHRRRHPGPDSKPGPESAPAL